MRTKGGKDPNATHYPGDFNRDRAVDRTVAPEPRPLVPVECRACGHQTRMDRTDAFDHPCPKCGRYQTVRRRPAPTQGALYAGDWFTADRRHALAALALHGQPFGFTWEDVDALRERADDVEGDDPDPFVYQEVGRLHSIADRIAALLPPRET